MIYPKFIKKDSKIAFIAPSLGAFIEPYHTRVKNAKNVLEEKGYKVECGPNTFGSNKALSATKEECGNEINHYFNDKTTDAIISVGGGELMYEVMNHVDFDILKNNPKWFMGFSDNTNLSFLLTTHCDIASIYGPCAAAFGVTPWEKSTIDAHNLLTGENLELSSYDFYEKESLRTEENLFARLNLTEPSIKTKIPNTDFQMRGRLLGGCLDILTLFLGTKYDKVKDFADKYQEDGIIWFLEACDLNVMSIRRAFVQLDNAGWFKHVKGFIIGRPLNGYTDIFDINRFEAVYEVIKKYNVPIIFDADLGHLAESMPLITGSIATVTTNGNDYKIKMELK